MVVMCWLWCLLYLFGCLLSILLDFIGLFRLVGVFGFGGCLLFAFCGLFGCFGLLVLVIVAVAYGY